MADNIRGDTDEASDIPASSEDMTNDMTRNDKTNLNGKNMTNKIFRNVRNSFRRVGEMNPLKNKAAHRKTEKTNVGNDFENPSENTVQSPASPGGISEDGKLYTLPEIPLVPLSVMQTNNLIKDNVLEEAYLNIISLHKEIQCELEALGKTSIPTELLNKKKDLNLLYKNLKGKLCAIVQQSSVQPSCNQELIQQVAIIIQEEEKRGDVGQMEGWRDVWRAAIERGVKETLMNIQLENREQNTSWLAVHLGQVGKVVVEHLQKVKAELTSLYPQSFNVFETYVSTFHKVIRDHLKGLLEKLTEVKDYYALLDFILKRYQSEKIMGSNSLQPELKDEMKNLNLDDHFLNQIKKSYCDRLQADMRSSLDNIIKLEHDEMWKDKNKPEISEDLYLSHIHMDILTYITGPIQASSLLDVQLEQNVMCSCLHELKELPKRFESAFVQWNETLVDSSLWSEYHIAYINSFRDLKEQIEKYKEKCPSQVEQLSKEINELVNKLSQALLDKFKTDTEPLLKMMMTRKWMSSEEDFQQLHKRIETLSQQCKHMSPQHAQEFVGDVHYFVVSAYISQLMKNNYSCKNRKNEKAAANIGVQWGELCELFQEMNSVQSWLYPVGDHLQKIIGERKENEIKNYLQPLVDAYPDFSQKHLSAILYFRGTKHGRHKQILLQKLSDLKQHSRNSGSRQHVLFEKMEASANTDCLTKMPFCSVF